jgi:hypothetical protein
MSRNLAFGRISFITVLTAAINAGAGIGFALLGWGYMSLAWAAAISTLAAMGLYLRFWRDWSIFRPGLREWRSVLGFSIHDSAFDILSQIGEAGPYLIIGRALDIGSVGLCQRAVLLALFPERVILAGVSAVALPAFSQQVRDGQAPKASYLKVLGLITAAQWPALLTLILFGTDRAGSARPAMARRGTGAADPGRRPLLLLSDRAAVPDAGRARRHSHRPRHYPGAIGDVDRSAYFCSPLRAQGGGVQHFRYHSVLQPVVARGGPAFHQIRLAGTRSDNRAERRGHARLCRRSLGRDVSAGWPEKLSISLAIAAGALAGAGWIVGLWLTGHPLLQEMMWVGAKLRSWIAPKLAGSRNAP